MANGICDGSCLCIRSITMRRVHTWGWRRTRRYDEPFNNLGPLSPRQSWSAYIIDTRGYDSREGQGTAPSETTAFLKSERQRWRAIVEAKQSARVRPRLARGPK